VTTQGLPVLLDITDGIARLTLDRPDAANAIDLATTSALVDAATALGREQSVRAVLLRGAGERFCGGGDVKAFADAGDDLGEQLREIATTLHITVRALAALEAPVVAAVQGSAAGAGLALVLGSDLAVMGESAKLVVAYTAIGLTPDGGTTWFLERAIGRQRALDLVLTNRAVSASEALAWGMVARVVPDAEVDRAAEALVEQLAAGPTRAFGAAKRLVAAAPRTELTDQLDAEAACLAAAGGSSDGQEGVAAFAAKRRPTFVGE